MKRGKFEANDSSKDTKPAEKDTRSPQNVWKSVMLYVHDLVYLLAIVLTVLLLCFRIVVVSGSSMNATLLDGDYLLLLSSTFYGFPKQGDIVVVSKDSFDNGDPIVKRVIAVEDQTVDIDFENGIVYVDGKALDEPYTLTPTTNREGVTFPLTVEKGCVFVLGDNRESSLDSRSREIGLIDCREIIGKAIFLFFPGTNKGLAPRDFSRIGALTYAAE